MKVKKSFTLDSEVVEILNNNIGEGAQSAYVNALIRWDINRCGIKFNDYKQKLLDKSYEK